MCYRRENGSGVCLDLQVIDNIPGAKVEEDTETHHVLAGNLYKPRRRVTLTYTYPHIEESCKSFRTILWMVERDTFTECGRTR